MATIRGDAADAAGFTRASEFIRAQGVTSDADLGPLLDAPDQALEADLCTRLRNMYDAGAWVIMESALADIPADLRWLYESGAVTIEQLAALHGALGVITARDLALVVEREQIRGLPRFDAAIERAVGEALGQVRAATRPMTLGRATAIVDPVLSALTAQPGVQWATPVGSLRRGTEWVGHIEIVAFADQPEPAIEALARHPDVVRVLHRSPMRLYVLIDRVQVGVRFVDPRTAGLTLLHLTGPVPHIRRLAVIGEGLGIRLLDDRLVGPDSTDVPVSSEADLYGALGLPCIPAELRDDGAEVQAALEGRLPALVSRAEMRGDLHMHSSWSDGRDSVEAMVAAAQALGYEYIAITDHSQHSAASRNLQADDVLRQADEIEGLRERYPSMAILHGCEVDIMPDGRLDFADRTLEQFDIVLASLHESAGHRRDQLLKRYIHAMRHPLVTIITHPTNRMVPYRPGYDLDYDRLFDVAVETGTVLEIDGSPAHLDMDAPLARRAAAAGVMIAINGDSHRAELLDRQMRLGVLIARRGWLEARHVVNTKPLAEVQALIARKRRT